ncbi:hypothetical protein [Kitasatospora sp. NPDC005748]|uniref:hypothetical protein n=1 Tax=Kitasatospora sp. NPDC005748 TaxID=3157063 RepID=UPI003406CA05
MHAAAAAQQVSLPGAVLHSLRHASVAGTGEAWERHRALELSGRSGDAPGSAPHGKGWL